MNRCGCHHYTNTFLFELNGLLRNLHGLARHMVKNHPADGPLRVAIYGAGTPGWLTASVLREYDGLQPVMHIDTSASELQTTNKDLRTFRGPALPVKTPQAVTPGEIDAVVCSVNPSAHPAIVKTLDAACPDIPRYFINYDTEMDCILPLRNPVLLVTASRCGSLWIWEMCRYASFYSGFSEVIPVDENNEFDYEVPGRMLPGQYTVSHHRLTPGILSLIERGRILPAFLYRDPRDIVVSKFFFSQRKRQQPAEQFVFKKEVYREVVDHIREWTRLPEVFQMRFEDLKQDTAGVFGSFCGFAGWEVEPERIGRIVEAHTFQRLSGRTEGKERKTSHYRKGISGDWANHFDEPAKAFAKEVSGEFLIELGYESDMDW